MSVRLLGPLSVCTNQTESPLKTVTSKKFHVSVGKYDSMFVKVNRIKLDAHFTTFVVSYCFSAARTVEALCVRCVFFFPYLAFKHRALAARLLQLGPSSVVAITKGERARFDGAAALSTLPL